MALKVSVIFMMILIDKDVKRTSNRNAECKNGSYGNSEKIKSDFGENKSVWSNF